MGEIYLLEYKSLYAPQPCDPYDLTFGGGEIPGPVHEILEFEFIVLEHTVELKPTEIEHTVVEFNLVFDPGTILPLSALNSTPIEFSTEFNSHTVFEIATCVPAVVEFPINLAHSFVDFFEVQSIESGLNLGYVSSWEISNASDTTIRTDWGIGTFASVVNYNYFGVGDPSDVLLSSYWGVGFPVTPIVGTDWGVGDETGFKTSVYWGIGSGIYEQTATAWEIADEEGVKYSTDWGIADYILKEVFRDTWGIGGNSENSIELTWETSIPTDEVKRVHWGWKYWNEICTQEYNPKEMPLELYFGTGYNNGYCSGMTLSYNNLLIDPRCPYENRHSGRRDRYHPPFPEIFYVPRKRVYEMINVVTVYRLPDNAPIEVGAINISIDRNSWLWSFSLTILDPDHIELIKPSPGTYVDIEITINGHVWICKVESWQEQVSFGQTVWNVSGRSPSCELSNPFSGVASYTTTSDMQAITILNDILSGTGWAASWPSNSWLDPSMTWLIPAGAFSFTNKTKIEAIKLLTESVGAYIQTVPDTTSQQLNIKAKYFSNPWNWSGATVDQTLVDSQFREIGRSFEGRPNYNSVITSGENAGVIVSLTRDGTAGDTTAPMYTNALITTDQAGTEAGRNILCDTGEWIKHTIRMFSLYPTGTPPSLILPGDFLGISEVSNFWEGQVTGTTIDVAVTPVVEVAQTIEIERYIGV